MASRVLVLSGGGPVGIAWETGIAAGLAEHGVHLGEANLIIGTSAGSVVGAQLAMGRQPQAMVAAQLARQENPAVAAVRSQGRQGAPDLTGLMAIMAKAAVADRPLEERLAEVGQFALSAQTIEEEAFIAGFGNRLAGAEGWTEKDFKCTAIDALSGQFVIWDRSSGVPLARAVASSCAVPGIYPPITIKGRRYYDGGIRSATNADLAKGYETVVIVSVAGGGAASSDPRAELARKRLDDEMRALKEAGVRTLELITPDDGSRESFGLNMMDSRRNADAAENGLRQGTAEAARLKRVWN